MRPISGFLASALGGVLCGLAFVAVPAYAADMAVPAPSYYPALPPAAYDWTGIYLGGHVGGGVLNDYAGQIPNTTGPTNLVTYGSLRPGGVIGGIQGGANYEFAPWVIGGEATWTGSAIKGSTLITTQNGATPQEQLYLTSSVVRRADRAIRLRGQ